MLERIKLYRKRWADRNRDKVRAYNKKHYNKKKRENPDGIRKAWLDAYRNKSPEQKRREVEARKIWYQKNKHIKAEKYRNQTKIWRENNKEAVKLYYKEFYEKNKEELNRKRREKYSKNREILIARYKETRIRWWKNNPDKTKEYRKKAYLKNREKILEKRRTLSGEKQRDARREEGKKENIRQEKISEKLQDNYSQSKEPSESP